MPYCLKIADTYSFSMPSLLMALLFLVAIAKNTSNKSLQLDVSWGLSFVPGRDVYIASRTQLCILLRE